MPAIAGNLDTLVYVRHRLTADKPETGWGGDGLLRAVAARGTPGGHPRPLKRRGINSSRHKGSQRSQESKDGRQAPRLSGIQELRAGIVAANNMPLVIGKVSENIGVVAALLGNLLVGGIQEATAGLEARGPEELAGALHGVDVLQEEGFIAGGFPGQKPVRVDAFRAAFFARRLCDLVGRAPGVGVIVLLGQVVGNSSVSVLDEYRVTDKRGIQVSGSRVVRAVGQQPRTATGGFPKGH